MKKQLSLLLSLTFTALWAQNVIYVNTNATGANNGSSWANARTNLSDALAAAQAGDEIWVAQGTYKPTRDTNHLPNTSRWATFRLKDSVKMYGGFTGMETQKAQREHRQNPTILSGNINNPANDSDNVYSVVYALGSLSRQTRLDGFTISEGFAYGTGVLPERVGAGIYGRGSLKVTFINLIIENNYAWYSSGAYLQGTRAHFYFPPLVGTFTDDFYFVNCIFRNNNANGRVGPAARMTHAKVSFLNCLFVNNVSAAEPDEGQLRLEFGTYGRVINCTFLGDTVHLGSNNIKSTYQSVLSRDLDSLICGNNISGGIFSRDLFTGTHRQISHNYFYFSNVFDTTGNNFSSSIEAPYFNNSPLYRPARNEYGINKGDTTYLPLDIHDFDEDGITNERIDFDLDNKPRVFGKQIDIGCYEYRHYTVDTTSQQICINDSALWRGNYLNTPGVYDHFTYNPAQLGDSVNRFILTHDSIITTITLSHWGNDFTSDEADTGSTYQWLKCFTDEPIPGATSRTFTPTENGNYKVVVTNSTGCIDTSECKALPNIGLAEQATGISFYPNPVHHELNVNCTILEGQRNEQVIVYNSQGQILHKQFYATMPGKLRLDLSTYAAGLYILQVGDLAVQFVKD